MSSIVRGLSAEEAGFLAYLASEGKEIFTIADGYAYWKDDPNTPFRLRDPEEKGWLKCVFRRKWPPDSNGSGPPIPREVAQGFRGKWPTRSKGSGPPWVGEVANAG